ncbi:ArsR/SmtB family transcription factor [Sneathiella limimaris]|uniref:ArsR/SmtB family transcription factor n=1 Tax=Sneathiella limimaris TaxID=1964213 RepID=UPI00146C74FB|nr:helix-turn-helix domain-containing protein [Sneathiella limimaris]
MKEGPDIALVASLIGDPARANMLTALLSGKALTATELAAEAGITAQTASTHLKKLEGADLIATRKQGRHKYFTLADEEVGQALEALMGLAAKRGLLRTRTGPRDPELRKARICYNHLAGDMGVRLYDGLVAKGLLQEKGQEVLLTEEGSSRFDQFGIDLSALEAARRPMCLSCLDWSERRTHLAGSLGSALLERFYEKGWAKRIDGTRIIKFSPKGEQEMLGLFG